MSGTREKEIIAAIDVGSYALRMKIVEVDSNAQQHNLELLKYPISLGSETYTQGSVNFDTVDQICDILNGFKKLMQECSSAPMKALFPNQP